jgi:hypothetical protein
LIPARPGLPWERRRRGTSSYRQFYCHKLTAPIVIEV